jgi:sentrin-specific protease 8
MSHMLRHTPDPLSLKSALPDFARTSHIFLPINNASNVTIAEDGSHWSLLLVSVIDGIAFHYDSSSHMNSREAWDATNKMSILLGRPLRFIELNDTPQQDNGEDCGVFVCMQMQHLLMKKLLTVGSTEKVNMSLGGKIVDAAGGRKMMLKVIEDYRKEGVRRRS